MKQEDFLSDAQIVELYWQRNESAIQATSTRYGAFCHKISYAILGNRADTDECLNDTWMAAWNSIPPHRPDILSAFLGKITRRISIDRWRRQSAEKRGGGELDLVLEELADCIAADSSVEAEMERTEMEQFMQSFLRQLPVTERRLFLRRYWYMDSIAVLAEAFGFRESKVKSMLFRTRKKLREKLESEGYM